MALRELQDEPARSPEGDRRGFRPDIQGLRALAVVLVVIYHLYPSTLPGGYVGVDVFFVISGFLITGHLLRGLQRTGRVGFVAFYGRRARRLMPAAALVLAVTWLASRIILPATQLPATATQIRASALYFQNWVLAHDAVSYLKSDQAATPVQHFWSLSVEEQFYLLWPLLFLIAGLLVARHVRRRSPDDSAAAGDPRHVMLVLGVAVTLASLAWSIYDTAADPSAAYFVTTTRMWELGAGGTLALLSAGATRRIARVGVLAWLGLVMILVSAFAYSGSSRFPGYIALLPVGGAVLMIGCGAADGKGGTSRFSASRPAVFIGDISYSLYLWHWPLIVLWKAQTGESIGLLSGLAIAVASVLLAWLTKVLVEDRVRLAAFFAKHDWRSVGTVTAAVVPVVLVSIFIAGEPPPFNGHLDANHPGAAVLAGDATAPAHTAAVPPLADATNDDEIGQNTSCLAGFNTSSPTLCRYGDTTNPRKVIALVGDSHAGQWSTDLANLATRKHWELVTQLHAECPWTATLMYAANSAVDWDVCQTWGVNVLHNLTTIKPDVVFVSERPSEGTPRYPAPGPQAWRQIASGMTPYWQQLEDAGIHVVAIRETPEMAQRVPDCLAARGATVSGCSTPASQAIRARPPVVRAVRSIGSSVPIIDMNPLICGPTTCEPVVGNVVVFRDSHHLTNSYMISLAPYFDAKVLATPAFATRRH